MSKSLQSKTVTRNQTAQIQIFSNRKLKFEKKHFGNSEFIKSKFDVDYDPKYRVLKSGKSPYNKQQVQKKQLEKIKNQELTSMVCRAQQEVKKGKKIIIDWQNQNNFRTTRFPSIGQKFSANPRSHTDTGMGISLKLPQRLKQIRQINSFGNSPISSQNKQIVSKSLYLQNLLSQSIFQKKKRRKSKIAHKTRIFSTEGSQFEQSSPSMSLSKAVTQVTHLKDPHFNYSIIEEVQEKKKQFFQKNHEKIIAAIDYENQINKPIGEQKKQSLNKKKHQIQQIQHRIVCKSKLTILKSDLARKFRQIRQGLFDQIPNSGGSRKNV